MIKLKLFFLILTIRSLLSINKKICFHTNELCERGTTVAIYDYAYYNEIILNNTSLFVLPNYDKVTKGLSYQKFKERFGSKIFYYEPQEKFSLVKRAKEINCEIVYIIKDGGINIIMHSYLFIASI